MVALAVVHASSASAARRARRIEVEKGDTLARIALEHGCSVAEIKGANGLNGDQIRIGQRLKIPKCQGKRRHHAREGGPRMHTHTVRAGDTLGSIAGRFGSTAAKIRKRNGLTGDMIREGQKLRIRATRAVRLQREVTYTIQAGDTLRRIGKRFRMDWKQIKRMNRGLNPRRLRIGDQIKLIRDGPAEQSETVGRPQDGKLINGEQLPPGPGYYRRRPHRAWGTNETITQLIEVIAAVRRKHPKVHDLAVGDLSAKEGGPLSGHKSHESGRDVDLGLYFFKHPKPRPKGFVRADKHDLDLRATWTLLTELTGRSERTSRVAYIFLDYGVQKRIYEWAKRKGKSKRLLGWMFQYPRGPRALRGLIRQEPNHHDHLHVRFKCPRGDKECL
jgi:LysM repeat protein